MVKSLIMKKSLVQLTHSDIKYDFLPYSTYSMMRGNFLALIQEAWGLTINLDVECNWLEDRNDDSDSL